MTRSKYGVGTFGIVESTVDCESCGHDLLDHQGREGCAQGSPRCACSLRFTKAEARRIAREDGDR